MTKSAFIRINSAIFILAETSCNVLFLKILNECHAAKEK